MKKTADAPVYGGSGQTGGFGYADQSGNRGKDKAAE